MVTTALFAFILAGLVAVSGFVVYAYGLEMFKEPDKQPFMKKMQAKYGGMADVMRGMLIVTSAPLIAGYFCLSFVNQIIRKCPCLPFTKVLDDSDRHLALTKVGSSLWRSMQAWRWSSVLLYAMYWGIFFFTCNVIISKFTVLFLSWLIEQLASVGLAAISAIFFVVGFIMFMLPPVPGVPVYLSSGIILVAAGKDSMGISGAITYAFVFCMVLKLLAALGQMYCFGVPLGKYVAVRRAVGVNSSLVRAMKIVLSKPMSVAKVSILVGGPDWPTSVMCGIMHLEPVGIILGTLPVGFLILPTILAGSFFYLSADDPDYAAWATIFAALAALVQSGAMLVAAFYLDKAAIAYKDELDAMPFDTEVLEADQAAEALKLKYQACIKWEVLPCLAKFLLVLATTLMVIGCYMVQLLTCFEPYELTSTISADLPGGKWYNLMTPTGFVACAFFLTSCLVLWIFQKWAARRAKAWPSDQEAGITQGSLA